MLEKTKFKQNKTETSPYKNPGLRALHKTFPEWEGAAGGPALGPRVRARGQAGLRAQDRVKDLQQSGRRRQRIRTLFVFLHERGGWGDGGSAHTCENRNATDEGHSDARRSGRDGCHSHITPSPPRTSEEFSI